MKTELFQSCGHYWIFQICWHIECSTLTASSFDIVISFPLDIFPGVEMLHCIVIPLLIFWRSFTLFSTATAPICIPTNNEFPFSPHPHQHLFSWCHPDRCEVIPHCGLDLHFLHDEWCWASFHLSVAPLYVFFGKNVYSVPLPNFESFFFFFFFWLLSCSSLCCAAAVLSCPTFYNPMDWSPPGSSVRGIFQARMLEWVAISFSRVSSQHKNWISVSCISCISRQTLQH